MSRSLRDITPTSDLALLSVEQMAAADATAIASGIPGIRLMAAAGHVALEAIVNRFPPQPTLVLAGPGNNGGDGYVVAEKLRRAGWPVAVASLVPIPALKGDAAWAAAHYRGKISPAFSAADLDGCSLVVDALFGAGLSRPLDGIARQLVEAIGERNIDCVAIDVPSGIAGNSGQVLGAAPQCRLTVSFFRAKPGHLLLPGRLHCGEVVVGGIGIGSSVVEQIGPTIFRNGPALWRDAWRPPAASDHKYIRGAALVVAGPGMTGAARLAAAATRRIGAGLVSIHSPDPATASILRTGEPGVIVREEALTHLLADNRWQAVLLGPGGGVSPALRQKVLETLRTELPAVLDADALAVFGDQPDALFSAISGPCLLTPHDGEFNRLFSSLKPIVNKIDKVKKAAQLSGATVLLKGPDTVVASPDGRVVVNDNAPPSLSTAGSGDVLAGFATGLIAQGLSPLAAGAAAAWIQGAIASRLGKRLLAEDLIVADLAHIPL